MTIKLTKVYEGGKTETTDVDETEFPLYYEFEQTMEAMIEKKCHSIIVQIPDGLQVLYTLMEKVIAEKMMMKPALPALHGVSEKI